MQKERLDKGQFYPQVIAQMEQARRSVHFYSVSCCFGFYSYGIKNFENVLQAIRERLKIRLRGKSLDVRVLVSVDPENPMDHYAAQCLASLEQKYQHTGPTHEPRQVFRELSKDELSPIEMTQFLIIDDEMVLVTEIQEEYYNEDLNLVLNISQPGLLFDSSTDSAEAGRLRALFEKAWTTAKGLDVSMPRISRRGLGLVLKGYKGVERAKNERDMQLLLTGYLQGQFSPAIVDFEATVVDSRIDLLVGSRPQHERTAIEIKFNTKDDDIDRMIGQIRKYKNEFNDVFLVVGAPMYSPRGRARLKEELDQISVPLIELGAR